MHIVLTRPQQASVELADILSSPAGGGHDCLIAPMLEIVQMQPTCKFGGVTGVLITSANGVQAAEHLADIEQAKVLPLYCVGARTSKLAQELGWQNIVGVGDSMIALTDVLIDARLTGRFVYLAGVDRAHEMGMLLRASGLSLDTCEIYHARAAHELSAALLSGFEHIDAVTLFSLRTATIFLTLIEQANLGDMLAQKKVFCLSENIASRCEAAGCKDVHFPTSPRREALIDLINR